MIRVSKPTPKSYEKETGSFVFQNRGWKLYVNTRNKMIRLIGFDAWPARKSFEYVLNNREELDAMAPWLYDWVVAAMGWEDAVTMKKPNVVNHDFVLDGMKFHLEFNTANNDIYLYIPGTATVCEASRLTERFPEIRYAYLGMLLTRITDYMVGFEDGRNGNRDQYRFVPDVLSVMEDVYGIAYDREGDRIFLWIPNRNIHTNLLTIDTMFPELAYMNKGVLLSVVKDFVNQMAQ